MSNVVKLPPPPIKHKQIVHVKEMYAQGDLPEQMVWDMCRYVNRKAERENCMECPRWEDYHGE